MHDYYRRQPKPQTLLEEFKSNVEYLLYSLKDHAPAVVQLPRDDRQKSMPTSASFRQNKWKRVRKN